MTDPVERRDLVERLTKIADASLRADGTDIPLGTELRAAAAEIIRLRSLLTPGAGAETTAEERAAVTTWRTINGDSPFMARLLSDLARAEARANGAAAERDAARAISAECREERYKDRAERDAANARAERLAGALRIAADDLTEASRAIERAAYSDDPKVAARLAFHIQRKAKAATALLTEPEAKGGDPAPVPATTEKTDD